MKVERKTIYLITLTIIYQLLQWYFWIYRWDSADSITYFYNSENIVNVFKATPYQLSSLFFKPFFLLTGYSIFSLMLGALIYRFAFYLFAASFNINFNRLILISFVFFPLHSLLSFFPGRDLFAIIFIYISISFALKNKFFVAIIFALFAAKFRIIQALPLFLALIFEVFIILKIKGSKFSKFSFASLIILLITYFIYKNLYILGYGISFLEILNKVQIEINSDYFNLEGYTYFPKMFLNLYYPLLSTNFFSIYSLLSIESLFATFLIVKGLFIGKDYNIPRFIKVASFLTLLVSLISCAIYPNITDMARKIYPLFLYASIILFYLKNRRNSFNFL